MNKRNKIILKGMIVLSLSGFFTNVFGLEYISKDNFVCTETSEYKNWTKLSKKEKAKTFEPIRCKEFYNNTSNSFASKYGSIQNVDYKTLTKFDLRDVNGHSYVTGVKDQGETELCWTFATNSSIESAYLIEKGEIIDLSEKHIAFNTTYKLGDSYFNPFGDYGKGSWNEAGNYYISGEYLIEGRGPVLESKVPWSTTTPNFDLTNTKADYYVNNVILYLSENNKEENINKIKELIVNYGSVSTTIFAGDFLNPISNYLASDEISYYVKSCGISGANHGVSIIGWDDDYPKEKFDAVNGTPDGNGAWLVQNSWGESFGDSGYFYISYYDKFVSSNVMAVNGVQDVVSDNNYFYDTVGNAINYLKLSQNKVIFKEKYSKKSNVNELLDKISFFIDNKLSYNFYYSEEDDFSKAKKIGEYSGTKMEYATLKLNNPISISSDSFYIFVELTSNIQTCLNDKSFCYESDIGYAYYVEKFRTYETEDSNEKKITYKPDSIVSKGVSYYSFDGTTWIETISNSNASFYPIMHAFTDTLDYILEINKINKSENNLNLVDGGYFEVLLNMDNVNKDNLSIKVLNSKNENVTGKFTMDEIENGYKFTINDDTVSGKYHIKISYKKISIESEEIVIAKNNDILVTNIEISGGNELSVNGTLNLTATVKPDNATNKDVTWSSSNGSVATVNENGVVTGISKGTVNITATSMDDSNVSATLTLKVIDINELEGNGKTNPNTDVGNNPSTGVSNYVIGLACLFVIAIILGIKTNKIKIFKKI